MRSNKNSLYDIIEPSEILTVLLLKLNFYDIKYNSKICWRIINGA